MCCINHNESLFGHFNVDKQQRKVLGETSRDVGQKNIKRLIKQEPVAWREARAQQSQQSSTAMPMDEIQVPLTWELNGLHKMREKHTQGLFIAWNTTYTCRSDSNLVVEFWHSLRASCPHYISPSHPSLHCFASTENRFFYSAEFNLKKL